MKTALVLGCCTDVGRSVCQGLFSLGWHVLLPSSDKQSPLLARELSARMGGSVLCVGTDCNGSLWQHLKENCGGRLDALILIAEPLQKGSSPLEGCMAFMALFKRLAPYLSNASGRVLFATDSAHRRILRAEPRRVLKHCRQPGFAGRFYASLLPYWLCIGLQQQFPLIHFYTVDPQRACRRLNTVSVQQFPVRNRRIYSLFSAGKASGGFIGLCQTDPPPSQMHYADRRPINPSPPASDKDKASAFIRELSKE